MATNHCLEVDRSDPGNTRTVEDQPAELGEEQVRLRIESFALTANNITYAVAGDMLGYWDSFPTARGADEHNRSMAEGLFGFIEESRSWLSLDRRTCADQVAAAWGELHAGEVAPDVGIVASRGRPAARICVLNTGRIRRGRALSRGAGA